MKTNLKISLAAAVALTSVVPNLALAVDIYTLYYDSTKGKVVYDLYNGSTDTTTIGIDLTGNDIDRLSTSKNVIEINIGDSNTINHKGNFYGGYETSSKAVELNQMELKSGTIVANLIGGESTYAVRNSYITISGGTIAANLYSWAKGDVYGGISTGGGAVTGSDITILGGTIEGSVYAGETSGAVSDSTITYIGGNVKGWIEGRYSIGDVINTTLSIGSYIKPVELSAAGIGSFNKVIFTLPKPELISNGFTALTLTDRSNGANLTRTDISVDYLESYIKGNNTYYLIKSAFGIDVDNTWLTNNQNLTGKEINVISSSQYNLAKGGIYKSSDDKELYIKTTTSTETIIGDTFGDDEAGIKDGITVNLANSNYDNLNINIANSATINLTNAHNVGSVISSGSTLDIKDGSTFDKGASIDVKTANFGDSSNAMVMDIYEISALKAKEINFYLPSNVANDETALKVANSVNLSGTKVNAYLKDATGITSKDDKIHLIQTAGKLTAPSTTDVSGVDVNVGNLINVKANIELNSTGKNLDLSFKGTTQSGGGSGSGGGGGTGGGGSGGATANANSKQLLENSLAGMVAVNESINNLVSNLDNLGSNANSGSTNANSQSNNANSDSNSQSSINENSGEAVVFANIIGHDKRFITGSHVDSKGFSLSSGIVGNDYYNSGKLTTGLFVEYGKAKYESVLDNGLVGEGKTEFIGGGAFGKFKFINNFYTEASARIGNIKTKAEKGMYDEYKLSNTYYGAHFGLGKVFDLTSSNELDIYAKYFYSHIAGKEIELRGVNVDLGSVTSSKFKAGFKDTMKFSDTSSLYAGLAYQYEAKGDAKGNLSAFNQSANIASPSLKGSTGIAELGYAYETNSIKFDIGAKGYVGKERGYSGNLGVTFKF